jgi:uncharacterized protein YggL (DUF469 family)
MRKRLRKKKYLGEFAVYGFEITFSVRPELTQDQQDEFLDRFLAEAIEGNRLLFGGGGGPERWSGFAVADGHRISATDAQRQAVERWLGTQDGIFGIHIAPLRDAYHG